MCFINDGMSDVWNEKNRQGPQVLELRRVPNRTAGQHRHIRVGTP
jgi:hypothetical protein